MPERRLTPVAARLFELSGVAPFVDWKPSVDRASIHYADHVDVDEALSYIAARAPAIDAPPGARVSIGELRRGLVASAAMQAASGVPLDALYEHQRAAIFSVLSHDDGVAAAKSATWVMACGVGKTLAAAKLATLLGVRTLVTVPNKETALQWRAEFARLGVSAVHVHGVDAVAKRAAFVRDPPAVVVLTYAALSMLAPRQGTAASAPWELLFLGRALPYGLHVLDECHVLPARTYAAATQGVVRARLRLAMTASLSRSDGKQADVAAIVGPVSFRLSGAQAHASGCATRVSYRVHEVPTPAAMLAAYRALPKGSDEQRALAVLNPRKAEVLMLLLRDAAHRKVVVYCDKLAVLDMVERVVRLVNGLHFAGVFRGDTPHAERCAFLRAMREAPGRVVGVVTRAGSTSFDVQDLDTVIEVDVGDASVQKITQRLGRAQRVHAAKPTARMYSLVSAGTHEVEFARERATAWPECAVEWHKEGGAEGGVEGGAEGGAEGGVEGGDSRVNEIVALALGAVREHRARRARGNPTKPSAALRRFRRRVLSRTS